MVPPLPNSFVPSRSPAQEIPGAEAAGLRILQDSARLASSFQGLASALFPSLCWDVGEAAGVRVLQAACLPFSAVSPGSWEQGSAEISASGSFPEFL